MLAVIAGAEGWGDIEAFGRDKQVWLKPYPNPSSPPEATIKIAGSDTMVNLSQAWAEEYMAKYPSVSLQVSGGGSGVGIKALTEGTIQLANASREMESDERQLIESRGGAKVQEYTFGLDALGI